MHIFKDFLHSNQLIVELIVGTGIGQEGVPVCDEKVENLHHLCHQQRKSHTNLVMHAPSTGLYGDKEDVEFWQQMFFTGGKKLQQIQ